MSRADCDNCSGTGTSFGKRCDCSAPANECATIQHKENQMGYGADYRANLPNTPQEHNDDIVIGLFAKAMSEKMAQKRAQGYGGWNEKLECPVARLQAMLLTSVNKGDPVDVANFAMMLFTRRERTVRMEQEQYSTIMGARERELERVISDLRSMPRPAAEKAGDLSADFVPKVYGPGNPPRLRRPDESAEDYRISMGWDAPRPTAADADDLLTAIKGAVPLVEPVTIRKALRAGRGAHAVLDGGKGPRAAVHLVNVSLQGWHHTKETAEMYAKGYNDGVAQLRGALLEMMDQARPTAVMAVDHEEGFDQSATAKAK